MYELKIVDSFAAAHSLRNFRGKCESLHGHNWKVEVWVRSDRLDETGLVLDFKVVKTATQEVLDRLDHKYLNELAPFATENPSSERIAEYIYKQLSEKLNGEGVRVHKVSAWESEDARAAYFEEGTD